MPLKSASGVYVKEPSGFSVSVPLLTSVARVAVKSSLLASLLPSTPGAETLSVLSSLTS